MQALVTLMLLGLLGASRTTATFDDGTSPHKPNIVIMATGGTIAAEGTESGYTAGNISIGSILAAVPELEGVVVVARAFQVCNVGSQNFGDELYVKLALEVREALRDPTISGVLVTHGTDTMAESAFFLDLVIDSPKPVVLVGSVRPATAVSADGPANLLDGARVLANPYAYGRGTMVVFGSEIHAARFVYKAYTESLTGFVSANQGPIGQIAGGKPRFLATTERRGQPLFEIPEAPFPKVFMLYAHGGMTADFAELAMEVSDGIVLCGVGNGNAPNAVLEALAEAVQKGIPVVRATRTGRGLVSRNIEVDDDALGFVASIDLNCPHAR